MLQISPCIFPCSPTVVNRQAISSISRTSMDTDTSVNVDSEVESKNPRVRNLAHALNFPRCLRRPPRAGLSVSARLLADIYIYICIYDGPFQKFDLRNVIETSGEIVFDEAVD
jgi:hypothetical protein